MRHLAERYRKSSVPLRYAVALSGATLLCASFGSHIAAHKAITSIYTYNDDIFPILRDKCGRCHVDGGPAPMSLMTYSESGGAVAWAESIKEMLIAEAMPPYFADPTGGRAVKNAHGLTPRELDKLLTWAAGGTPQGDLNKKPPAMKASVEWPLGKPDLVVAMDKEVSLPPGEMEKVSDLVIPTNLREARWVKAVDLLPGTPSIVRQATIGLENGPTLAVWEPGDDPAAAPDGTAFALPAGATLHVKIRHRKSWNDEQETRGDKSSIGLYFTTPPSSGKSIQALAIDGPASSGEGSAKFAGTLNVAGRVLALRTMVDQPYGIVDINAVPPTGAPVPLLKLRAQRPEWPRRYWLADPVQLPAGTKIEVTTTANERNSGPLGPPFKSPLQIAVEIDPR